MGTLWGAATIKLVGAGATIRASPPTCPPSSANTTSPPSPSPATATGHTSRRYRYDASGSSARRTSARSGAGPLSSLATGTRPALLTLHPWFQGPHAAELTADTAAAIDAISDAADRERMQNLLAAAHPHLPASEMPEEDR